MLKADTSGQLVSLMINIPENSEGENKVHLDRPFCWARAIVWLMTSSDRSSSSDSSIAAVRLWTRDAKV